MAYSSEEKHTKAVLKRWEDIPDPRLREVMQSALKHLHAFVSEVRPTGAEWFKAIEFLTQTGQKCDDKRQEFILLSDTMGVSMLVDEINNRRVAGATPSTVEGPFHIPDAPEVAHGASMAGSAPGIPCFVSGTVRGPKEYAGEKSIEPPGSIIHEVGGALPGTDPKKSVVNGFNQTWDVKNLFLCDGAPFASNADKNPTLTLMALAWRACDYLVDKARKGEL